MANIKEFKSNGHTYHLTDLEGECTVQVELVDPVGGMATIKVAPPSERERGYNYQISTTGWSYCTFSQALDVCCQDLASALKAKGEEEVCQEMHKAFGALP